MPGPIGQEDEPATTPGAAGSLNAKFRLMTSQLDALANGGGIAPSTGTVIVRQAANASGSLIPWAVSGTVTINQPGTLGVSGTITINTPGTLGVSGLIQTLFFNVTTGLYQAASGQTVGNAMVPGPVPLAGVLNAMYNGTTWDPWRNNYSQSLKSDFLIGAGITSGATFTNYNGRGVLFTLTVTAASGTNPTLGVQIQGQNADGQWFNLPGAAFAAQTAAGGCTPLYIEPGAASTANLSVNSRVPRAFRAVYSVGGTAVPSFTFTLDADYCT